MVRSILKGENLPHSFWGEVAMTKIYVFNKCPTKLLDSMVPKEAWSRNKPSVKNFKIFGSLCYKHVPDQRRNLLDDKHENKIFVRYKSTSSYKLYNPENQQVTFNKDFDEAGSWEEFQPKSKTSSNIHIGWEDVDSRVDAHYKVANNEP